MTLSRSGWLGILALITVGVGVAFAGYWPRFQSGLPFYLDGGMAAVAAEASGLSAAQRRTLHLKVDLNAISEDELARLPGIGRLLAKKLVEARKRLQRFRSWEEVDAVRGVGPIKLKRLQEQTEIRP